VTVVEQVLVVPRRLALPDGSFRGLMRAEATWLEELVASSGEFRSRPEMEADRTFKQVIPYLVLRDGPRWFLMKRTRAGVDQRLHDRYSIGVGGHLNPGDSDLLGGLRREWREELVADFEPSFEFIGLLNDDETEVGSVHLGAVFTADADGRQVTVRETDKLVGSFVDSDEVESVRDRMESWSSLLFDSLHSERRDGRPATATNWCADAPRDRVARPRTPRPGSPGGLR
jgi:predicted NUDIX family phosphoesterase